MNNRIKQLPQDLINQIAAGEVIERPASVVKELVENSLDAGATNITIEIENGGLNLVKIVDNGSGMDRQDAESSIREHATSKISGQDDLFNINTFGFRGEALPSIASVSDFSLMTKRADDLSGTSIIFKDGELTVNDIGCAAGTTVAVREIFYNIPARRKYMKTPVTEFGHITDLFFTYALAFPKVGWKLTHNGKPVYQFPASGDWRERVIDVLGEEVGNNLIEVNGSFGDVAVTGFIGKPQIARNNRKLQYLFVNRRPVNEFIIAKQIKDAYLTLLPRELFPVYILSLDVLTSRIDVNVHPRKLEVRFSEPQIIYRAVYNTVTNTLDSTDLTKNLVSMPPPVIAKSIVPPLSIAPTSADFSIPIAAVPPSSSNKRQNTFQPIGNILKEKKISLYGGKSLVIPGSPKQESQPVDSLEKIDAGFAVPAPSLDSGPFDSPAVTADKMTEFRVVGQINRQYIVVETVNSMRIYDQHAASERVRYEKLKNDWHEKSLASQYMVAPLNIELSLAEKNIFQDKLQSFIDLGFDISHLGGNTFIVSAVPQCLSKMDIRALLLEMIANIMEEFMSGTNDPYSSVENIIKTMACKSAIKFGDELSSDGMKALIADLNELPNHYTCVHGRPCVLEYPFLELEKLFKRRK